MFNQDFRTNMGTKCAPAYAFLTIRYQKETKLFTQELPKYFAIVECELIKEVCKRYMDDQYFSTCLNNLHPGIKYTFYII